ncbi:hypothetical protein U0070_008700 [Myodes glareolus]|uniref:Uncharacterized protein n=1 Tax=Myodes glareolus TaxID=447135 RepID=A0AAW0IBG3_MYOGA
MACFAKALEAEPENPEYSIGYAITAYREDCDDNNISLEPLRKAVMLNPTYTYTKVYLALKLQDVGETEEAERHIEEALSSTSCQTYVFRYAAKYFRRKRCIDQALQLLHKALQTSPDSGYLRYQIGLCYKKQIIQLKTSRNKQPRRQSNMNEMAQRTICEFQKTVELWPTFEMAYVCMAKVQAEIRQYEEAEANFQKALNMKNLAGAHRAGHSLPLWPLPAISSKFRRQGNHPLLKPQSKRDEQRREFESRRGLTVLGILKNQQDFQLIREIQGKPFLGAIA